MTVESEERQSKLELDLDMHSVEPSKSHNPTYSQRLLDRKCFEDMGLISFVPYTTCWRAGCL